MAHLFFDLDGTLTEPAVGIIGSYQHAIAALSRPAWHEAELRRFIGPPLRDAFRETLVTQDSELIERALALYRERFAAVGLFENQLYDGLCARWQSCSARATACGSSHRSRSRMPSASSTISSYARTCELCTARSCRVSARPSQS